MEADDDVYVDRLERELEGDGTESDSSLDLHTPFAWVFFSSSPPWAGFTSRLLFFFSRHVMLRDGLISPRSKVITALDTSNRPGSTVSASKSYIIFLLKENSHLVLF